MQRAVRDREAVSRKGQVCSVSPGQGGGGLEVSKDGLHRAKHLRQRWS